MSTEKQQDLKNQLANKAGASVDKPRTPEQRVGDYLKAMSPTLQQILPSHLNNDRFGRIALNVIRTNPTLLECSLPSLMGAVLESAKLGLEVGILGHAYFVPFNRKIKENGQDKWVKDVQFIVGYKGLIELTLRSGKVKNIFAYEVHENDYFEYELGTEQFIKHKPTMDDAGEVIAYYAVAELDNGSKLFQVMSKKSVEKHRDQFSKAKYGPWVDSFDSMALKTVIRKLTKYLPISVEYARTIENDGKVRKDITDEEGYTPQMIDNETGEIIDVENNN